MDQQTWTRVDEYFGDLLFEQDEALRDALRSSADAGLPPINVSPMQGKLLHLLARIQGARNILEIGTLGGYSTIWLARALPPDGKIITLEFEPKHAQVAQANFTNAGLSSIIELRVGRAIDTLPLLQQEGKSPFDMIFIDADKPSNPDYLQWALKLSRTGTLIIVDNVVRKGNVIDEKSEDPNVIGVRKMAAMLASEKRLTATAMQTVGCKGYDGFVLAVVK